MKNRKYYGLLFRGLNPKSRIPGPQENAPAIFREDDHEEAVSPENWKKVNDGIKSRHKSRGPTRSHSSPNPLSDRLKCGHCAARGIDSNLQLQKQNGKLSVRCSRKKKMGVDVCQFKSANLITLLARIRDRLEHHFLTSENLAKVVDGVAEISRSMLEEKQTQLTHIRARKRVVNTKIQNINDVVELYGTQATELKSLTNNLAKLEKESADLEKEGNQIDAATEEALLFVNDRDGIIETALDHKTWIDSADPEAIREFLKIFIEKVEVFELEDGATDQRAVIHYDLRAFKAVAEGTSPTETIHIGKKKSRDDASTNNCGLDGSTGGTSRLLKSQCFGTTFGECRGPLTNGMGIPFQRLPYRRCPPTLGQQPHRMPPFPLPGRQLSVHPSPHFRLVHAPPLQQRPHLRHAQQQPPLGFPDLFQPSHPPLSYPNPMQVSPWLWFSITTTVRCAASGKLRNARPVATVEGIWPHWLTTC